MNYSWIVYCMNNVKSWTGLTIEGAIRAVADREVWRKIVCDVTNPRIEDGWGQDRTIYCKPSVLLTFLAGWQERHQPCKNLAPAIQILCTVFLEKKPCMGQSAGKLQKKMHAGSMHSISSVSICFSTSIHLQRWSLTPDQPTSTYGNYPGTASNPTRAYRQNGRQCRR